MLLRPPRSTLTGTLCPYTTLFRSDFSLRVPNGLQHGISERGDYANRVQGDAASHALNGVPYWTYMRRRAELSTQVFHSNGSRSEEHTSVLLSLMRISFAVFCLKTIKLHLTSFCLLNYNK